MSLFGIGFTIALWVVPLFILLVVMQYIGHVQIQYCIGFFHAVLFCFALSILFVGLIIYALSARCLLQGWSNGKIKELVTWGPFKYSSNPMYFCFIFIFIPVTSIFLNNILLLLVSVVFLIPFFILIKKEEYFLLQKFGENYNEYKKQTALLFPLRKSK